MWGWESNNAFSHSCPKPAWCLGHLPCPVWDQGTDVVTREAVSLLGWLGI